MNIILNDNQREIYKDAIQELHTLCPDTISRKIPRANIQQAYMLDTVRKLSTKDSEMLCVGSYEDTASEALKKLGYNIYEIDPSLNFSLDEYFKVCDKKFDVVFSTSVIEHVQGDNLFIEQMCKLLKPNGYGIITCDFKDGWKQGDPKPSEDYRLYSKQDLLQRFASVLKYNACDIYGSIDYDHPADFQYGIYTYTFATLVFKKN